MAVFKKGDIFEAPGIIIFGAGSIVDGGHLMMDHVIRRDLDAMVPGISRIFGKTILEIYGNRGLYGLILQGKFGLYQIGYGLNDLNLDVLRYSMGKVSTMARLCMEGTFNIYCPDITNGKLEDIGPLVLTLPDNVHVWIRREVR